MSVLSPGEYADRTIFRLARQEIPRFRKMVGNVASGCAGVATLTWRMRASTFEVSSQIAALDQAVGQVREERKGEGSPTGIRKVALLRVDCESPPRV